jgi:serine O-acetyltransferase
MDPMTGEDQCRIDLSDTARFRGEIPDVVDDLVLSCEDKECFDHISPEPIPSRESMVDLIVKAMHILFPGYFLRDRVDRVNLGYYLGQEVTAFFEALAEQITLSIRHECLRHEQDCTHCRERGHETALAFLKELPRLRRVLARDVVAAHEGDPAAKGYDEIIFSYPGVFAVTVYRIAHQLYHRDVPLIPRIMTEYAHSRTGIDIHPGAQIGERFFIDHGTGVVIGETAEIGDRVRIYQGVTLGALSLPRDSVEAMRQQKRHPTIQDDVVIYSGATILGGKTVIGARSIIGGSVWITQSVPPDMKVFLKSPELVFRGPSR